MCRPRQGTHLAMRASNKCEYFLLKRMGKTISDYKLIENNDRIIVAVSGGKDSLSLLRLLTIRSSYVPIKYELLAVHIDFGYSPAQVEKLNKYLQQQGYQYHIEKRSLDLKPGEKINCFWCSWNRRKALFEVADRFGFKKIALAHNKDDLVETALLNLFYHGEISTILPSLEFFNGRFLLIRPLVNVEACELKRYADIMHLPYHEHSCPFKADTTKRAKIKGLILSLSRENRHIKRNILKSIQREKILYKPRRMLGLK